MSVNTIYILSLLIPLVLMPMLLPAYVLVAHRKRITDNPGPRKRQLRPVAVMGGTVMMLVICISAVIINLFYDISSLFPVICVMCMLYIFGMMDDTIGLVWVYKMLLQVVASFLLFFGSNYGVHALYGIPGFANISPWLSCVLTVIAGVVLLNAVNFSDGIDGLASALGVLAGLTMGYWHMRHGFVTQAIISFVMVGVMTSFFIFNVFSKRYKTYMGDSGSLVLGLFIFVVVTDDKLSVLDGSFLADNYSFSAMVSVLSVMLFDMFRVVALRIVHRKAPYKADRSHLHHVYVDMGMNHLMATVCLLFSNVAVMVVWLITALLNMPIIPQLFLTLLGGAVFVWLPYGIIVYLQRKHASSYVFLASRCRKLSVRVDKHVDFIGRIIDGRLSVKNKRRKFLTT